MKRILIAVAALAALLAPTGAVAKPSKTDKRNAARECRAERGAKGSPEREAFNARYGTNANKRNAFGKCVSRRARDEQRERRAAKSKAKKQCRAERTEMGRKEFADKYGTNRNKRNAFGKCVSQNARKNKKASDRRDRVVRERRKNAARECRTERTEMGRKEFADKYGTNRNKRNAFGKCVSQKARA